MLVVVTFKFCVVTLVTTWHSKVPGTHLYLPHSTEYFRSTPAAPPLNILVILESVLPERIGTEISIKEIRFDDLKIFEF